MWKDRINKNIQYEKLRSIAINASSQISEMEHIIVKLEKDRENYKVKYRQAVLDGEKLKEKYRENLFSEKLGNKIQNPSRIKIRTRKQTAAVISNLISRLCGETGLDDRASEKFKMKQELNTAREEYLKQLNEERQSLILWRRRSLSNCTNCLQFGSMNGERETCDNFSACFISQQNTFLEYFLYIYLLRILSKVKLTLNSHAFVLCTCPYFC